jgi:hypothetical protein
MDLRPTLTLIHVLAALVFVIAHAVSAVAMFQVRGQSDRAVLTATLNRSLRRRLSPTSRCSSCSSAVSSSASPAAGGVRSGSGSRSCCSSSSAGRWRSGPSSCS